MLLSDVQMDGGSSGTTGLFGDSQPDFRSILAYGVQESWVQPSSIFSNTCVCFHGNPRQVLRPVLVLFRRKFSDGIAEMLVVCATTVHRVGLKTAPNELCPRVPLMAWNTCAFTIQAIGSIHTGSRFTVPHLFFSVWFAFLYRKHSAGRGQAAVWIPTKQTGEIPEKYRDWAFIFWE